MSLNTSGWKAPEIRSLRGAGSLFTAPPSESPDQSSDDTTPETPAEIMRSDDARRRRTGRLCGFVHIQNVSAGANMLPARRSSAVSTQFGPCVFRRGGRHIAAVAQQRTC